MADVLFQGFPYVISSFFIGILVGLTGVGGGALMTPILILFFGVSPCQAVGTDLFVILITKVIGTFVHYKIDNINKRILLYMCCGSIPASIFSSLYLYFSVSNCDKNKLIYLMIGGLTFITSIGMLMVNFFKKQKVIPNVKLERIEFNQIFITILTGAFIGITVTFTSIGAGVLGMLVLFLLYGSKVNFAQLVGTDIAHSIPIALIAGIGHFFIGDVDFGLMFTLLLGTIPGILIGSSLTGRIPNRNLGFLISIMLFTIGIKMILMYSK